MKRRYLMHGALALAAVSLLPVTAVAANGWRRFHAVRVDDGALERLDRTAEAWRRVLDEDAWRILFREGTEQPFSSPLNEETRDGTYICAACFLPLFSSATKFESGTGWPSFYAPIEAHVDTRLDLKLVWPRTEYHCIRCGGHQGHVFDDGPDPTGQRWCNNGLALRFVAAGEALPQLRG
ncbi:peptide-methionine (R)-S-oxide reductase MsrB [Aquisalimonas lutea]|uniref:peptide-methionine (R)-S-oxide reductase MsrB n=1 Tax=Aquisalimonas lutea TaxID=1327750 RepID=UPI0025B3E77E|nr:peptide-methionine (R)-S-oxide reductase MsrB [Aquisalimonas lutea]MDN3519337.1 peptide-methionine (R)-S-oxide reductase MsrB [Aquisalimonas lutea]